MGEWGKSDVSFSGIYFVIGMVGDSEQGGNREI